MKTITKGKTYYYGEERLKVVCVKPGKKLSFFVDDKGNEYQFYNEDVYETN